MYTVIIIDDETWICKLVRKIVPWEKIGFNIIAETGNGQTALQLIKTYRPDLVITDIRMPGLDGIGLIKAVREQEIDTEFIIISGYSDFEYARSAVTYNVFGYLLKPLGKEEFEEILLKVREKIEAKLTIKDKIDFSNKKMLEQAVLNILSRADIDVSPEELNTRYGTKLKEGLYRVAVFKIDSGAKTEANGDSGDFLNFLQRMKKAYTHVFYEIIFIHYRKKTIAVLNYGASQHDRAVAALREIIIHWEGDFKGALQMTIGLGNTVEQLKDIGASYKAAENAVRARVVLGGGKVIDAEDKNVRMTEVKNIVELQEEKKLAMNFDVFDMNSAALEISKVFKRVEKAFPENALIYHLAAAEIINILYASMGRKDADMNTASLPDKEAALLGLDECATKEDIEKHIHTLLKKFCDLYEGERQKNGNKLINEIKVYVAMNYMLDIGLDDVARLVCLNSTYVSEVFKKRTGENFSEYLISYRIAIAKDLLKDVKYKVIDVSQMVGYKDPKYFSRIFKQKVGVNPTDYRNLYV